MHGQISSFKYFFDVLELRLINFAKRSFSLDFARVDMFINKFRSSCDLI